MWRIDYKLTILFLLWWELCEISFVICRVQTSSSTTNNISVLLELTCFYTSVLSKTTHFAYHIEGRLGYLSILSGKIMLCVITKVKWQCGYSVMSNFLQPWTICARLPLCPWNFSRKNTGIGCTFFRVFQPKDSSWISCIVKQSQPSEPPGKPASCHI